MKRFVAAAETFRKKQALPLTNHPVPAVVQHQDLDGQVVLGVDLGSSDYYGLASELRVIRPHTNFLAATPHWGFVQLIQDPDDEVREHFHGSPAVPSLSWKLASLLNAEVTKVLKLKP